GAAAANAASRCALTSVGGSWAKAGPDAASTSATAPAVNTFLTGDSLPEGTCLAWINSRCAQLFHVTTPGARDEAIRVARCLRRLRLAIHRDSGCTIGGPASDLHRADAVEHGAELVDAGADRARATLQIRCRPDRVPRPGVGQDRGEQGRLAAGERARRVAETCWRRSFVTVIAGRQ